jgi:hypothetical protein
MMPSLLPQQMSIDKNYIDKQMLKRIDISSFSCHSIEIDGYIPFAIYLNEKSPDLYWRAGNGSTSLIEIGLLKTGELSTIKLITYDPQMIIQTIKSPTSVALKKTLLPVFDVSSWVIDMNDFSSQFKDAFDTDFQLLIGLDYIELAFLSIKENTIESFQGHHFSLGFNDHDEFVSLQILNIDKNKMALLRESLRLDK